MNDWGKIFLATRLEKQVEARFVIVWSELIKSGLRKDDRFHLVSGFVAHKALNSIVRTFLKESDCDTLLTLDSDAIVEPDFIEQFRTYEPGYEYDALQAFYIRRGWPPQAIWMKRNVLGVMTDVWVYDDDGVSDVDVVGTHACLFRRDMLVKMLGDNDINEFEWFYYPRGKEMSEDVAFSLDAREMGFRLGATTHVKTGHLSSLNITWDSYHDYLHASGKAALIKRYENLALEISRFTGEDPDLIVAKSLDASRNVKTPWIEQMPESAEQVRAFYGNKSNGYLYDLLYWNCQPAYQRIIEPLANYKGKRVLVIGSGLGVEAELLAGANQVDVFELPGVLREFGQYRLGDMVNWLPGDRIQDAPLGKYDLIVALDVLEHIHPDEFREVMDTLTRSFAPGGHLYAHNNWGDGGIYPMHYDNSAVYAEWKAERQKVAQGNGHEINLPQPV